MTYSRGVPAGVVRNP